MEHKDVRKLLKKYRKGRASAYEKSLIESWYLSYKHENANPLTSEQFDQINDRKFVYPEAKVTSAWDWYKVAAVLLILSSIAFSVYKWGGTDSQTLSHVELERVEFEEDYVRPENHAFLTVGEKTYELNTEKSGIRITDGGVSYMDQGGVLHDFDSDEILELTVETSRGGRFQVVLPDGSLVWLNSSSKLVYPERFASNERIVELTGEAYFDVHHFDEYYPFLVKTAGQTIEVLGTRFNVKAYEDGSNISTTLLEGSVQVSLSKQSEVQQLLFPNQQSIWDGRSSDLRVVEVDAAQSITWIQGLFTFDNLRLEDILKEVSRWYDLEVVFEKESLKNERFGGYVSRNTTLSEVLKMLTLTETVRFKIENNPNKIIVIK